MKHSISKVVLLGLGALLSAPFALAQIDTQFGARQIPGWDPRATEGHCEIRVWIDNRAEVRMRGDRIFVRTLEGSRSRDGGSQCSQPLPVNSVRDFEVRQLAGGSRVSLAKEPSRVNDFTATIEIGAPQGGGEDYVFEVAWRADEGSSAAPAPFFDEVRACQDAVRQRFLMQNGRGAYLDFEVFAERQGQNHNENRGSGRGRNRSDEVIQGWGSARSRNEAVDLTYSCIVNTNLGQVVSETYQYSGNSFRTNETARLR